MEGFTIHARAPSLHSLMERLDIFPMQLEFSSFYSGLEAGKGHSIFEVQARRMFRDRAYLQINKGITECPQTSTHLIGCSSE